MVNMNKALLDVKNKLDEYNQNPSLLYNGKTPVKNKEPASIVSTTPKEKAKVPISGLVVMNDKKQEKKLQTDNTKQPVNQHINKNLTNYWPLNGNSNDIRTNLDLKMCKNSVFTKNGYDGTKALLFKNSYAIAPNGVYFDNDLTISAWVKLNSLSKASTRLIDFGDEKLTDNVIASLSSDSTGRPYFQVNSNGVQGEPVMSNIPLELGKWEHLSFTLKDGRVKIYINGELTARGYTQIPRNVQRTSNLIGIRNGLTSKEEIANNRCDFEIMDLKFFSKALNQFDVISAMTDRFSK